MIDKTYCMSSYLAFRYIEKDNVDFYPGMHHKTAKIPARNECVSISSANELDVNLKMVFDDLKNENVGLLLSGGMDSGCLASYMPVEANAYTFRFKGGYALDELKRAEGFAENNKLNLHYVDIEWKDIRRVLPVLMKNKAAPVHSIEPQIYLAALQALKDGVTMLAIGDAADYVFYGMDGLLSQDWDFDDFVKRSIYINPKEVLSDSADIMYLYERYRRGNKIDFLGFYDKSITEESYGSYDNALETAKMPFIDPYKNFVLANPIDLARIRNGESKYFIRELFRKIYPNLSLPEKKPMPRPVDNYFKNWSGPKRKEFKRNLDMSVFSGNQKWLLFCLEEFLNIYEPA